jgi:hypothetical protein
MRKREREREQKQKKGWNKWDDIWRCVMPICYQKLSYVTIHRLFQRKLTFCGQIIKQSCDASDQHIYVKYKTGGVSLERKGSYTTCWAFCIVYVWVSGDIFQTKVSNLLLCTFPERLFLLFVVHIEHWRLKCDWRRWEGIATKEKRQTQIN